MAYDIPEIAKNVFSVGSKDPNRKFFDALIRLHKGTSYNAYLIKGNDKVALIDTVNPGFEEEFLCKLVQLIDLEKLDYLIMNHAEPDHATAIPLVIGKSSATLIATEKGAKIAEEYYKVPKERIRAVKEGDSIELGGKTLRFIDAPWLHWPETMFTYLVEDKILFPCDFFGAHNAYDTYDEDAEDLLHDAKSYFAEIMMPFRAMGRKALDKIKDMDIKIIAPSHGPIYKNPQKIIPEYIKWNNGETENKVVIVYASMWGSTEKMVEVIKETLMAEGVKVVPYNLVDADIGEMTKDLVDSRGIVIGSPCVLNSIHPLAVYAVHLIKVLKPPVKYGVFLGSYGWGALAAKQATELLKGTNIELLGAVEVKGRPTKDDNDKVTELGKRLSAKIIGG